MRIAETDTNRPIGIPRSCDIHPGGVHARPIGVHAHIYRCGCAWGMRADDDEPSFHRGVTRDERPFGWAMGNG